MGQVESQPTSPVAESSSPAGEPSPPSPAPASSSLEALAAEAMSFNGDDTEESIDVKGSDCVKPFIALQDCIKENPEAFSKEILEEEENDEDAEKSNLKVRAPAWSKESKPKL